MRFQVDFHKHSSKNAYVLWLTDDNKVEKPRKFNIIFPNPISLTLSFSLSRSPPFFLSGSLLFPTIEMLIAYSKIRTKCVCVCICNFGLEYYFVGFLCLFFFDLNNITKSILVEFTLVKSINCENNRSIQSAFNTQHSSLYRHLKHYTIFHFPIFLSSYKCRQMENEENGKWLNDVSKFIHQKISTA